MNFTNRCASGKENRGGPVVSRSEPPLCQLEQLSTHFSRRLANLLLLGLDEIGATESANGFRVVREFRVSSPSTPAWRVHCVAAGGNGCLGTADGEKLRGPNFPFVPPYPMGGGGVRVAADLFNREGG